MLDEHVELLERAFVEQDVDALASGQAALGMLRVDAFLPATEARVGAAMLKLLEGRLHTLSIVGIGWPAACTPSHGDANVVL